MSKNKEKNSYVKEQMKQGHTNSNADAMYHRMKKRESFSGNAVNQTENIDRSRNSTMQDWAAQEEDF